MYCKKFKLAESFIDVEGLELLDAGISAVLLGGSVLYKYSEDINFFDTSIISDFDGIILLKTKDDLTKLVNEKRADLLKLLRIEKEEYPELKLKKNSLWYDDINAVRLSGWDKNKVKKSVKLVTEDSLHCILTKKEFGTSISILSFKDHKLWKFQNNDQFNRVIQQSTYIEDDLVILHEFDMISTVCPHNHGNRMVCLSPTSDLLLTGSWIYEASPEKTGQEITELLLKKLLKLNSSFSMNDLINVFYRKNSFGPSYLKEIQTTIKKYFLKFHHKVCETKVLCDASCFKELKYIFGHESIPQKMINLTNSVNSIPELDKLESNYFIKNLDKENFKFRFWRNDQHGKTLDGQFWKLSMDWQQEVKGSFLVSKYYRNTTIFPIGVVKSKNILLYPFHNGRNVAFLRLDYEVANKNLFEKLVLIELQRTDIILGAYISSASISSQPLESIKLKRFFIDRLLNENRLKELYSSHVLSINGRTISLQKLLSSNIIVNGTPCGKLKTLCKKSEYMLRNNVFLNKPQLTICGLGDGHCGNVLVSNCSRARGQRFDLVNIDYEVAGIHSPWLDLAKPFYTDVFFHVIYADYIKSITGKDVTERKQLRLSYIDESINIELNLQQSELSKVIYGIKTKYLIIPFLKFLQSNHNLEIDKNWPIIFGHAMFCCAVLARDYSDNSEIFFLNLALGAAFMQITGFNQETGRFTGLEIIGL